MAKYKTRFVCQSCGSPHSKWQGRCGNCGEWNTLVEEVVEEVKTAKTPRQGAVVPKPLSNAGFEKIEKIPSGFPELDRVLGGGIVSGSVILLSGEPGIGKSTLLLQSVAKIATSERRILYVAAEESAGQVKLRADRLGAGKNDNILLLADTDANSAAAHSEVVDAVVVDSIQAMNSDELESAPGNVAQVRHCAAVFIDLAKRRDIPVFLVGHVTKTGAIAGPKVLEHAVDVVLTLEGDRQGDLRLLRATKNRFGATGEIGVFSMSEAGFVEVENASSAFLGHHECPVPGSVVYAGMEGSRPLLVEIQALASPCAFGPPQRVAQGLDVRRLILLAAILERRAGLPLSRQDIFVNVVGGVDISERALDLAVMLAISSSMRDIPISSETVVFGEVGLTGELRSAPRAPIRLKEAARLGFKKAIFPSVCGKPPRIQGMELVPALDIFRAFSAVFGGK